MTGALKAHALPAQIGSYRILDVIGQGGMGIVYLAEQQRTKRNVALKVIRPGLATPAMLRRFEYETEVLARLDHSGIARIFEAGIAETGSGPQPYFAMELVEGKRLDEFVRETRPSARRRLELLIEICQAVHHAHTKGLIHRDLKPSNILIGGDGHARILDFGVARAIDSDIRSTTLATESGQLVGTLPYMAPEQAAGKVNELDTSSDVYALGVIAYELLSGAMPYSIEGKALHEAVRVICEQEPSRLSSIDRSLRGDVETIVQKALEKDRTRRYHTAGEFAADVKRYLDYEPITARPPGTWYQLAKFAKRNKMLVGGVAMLLVVLLAGVITVAAVAAHARREAARATAEAEKQAAVNHFLQQILNAADPYRMLGDKVTVLQATQSAVQQLDKGALAKQPLVAAVVYRTIGNTLRTLGRLDEAEPHLVAALEIMRRDAPDDHVELTETMMRVAWLRQAQGKFDLAEPLLRDALDIRRESLPPEHPDLAESLSRLAWVLQQQHKSDEAEPLYREALAIRRKVLPPLDRATSGTLNDLAFLLRARAKYVEA